MLAWHKVDGRDLSPCARHRRVSTLPSDRPARPATGPTRHNDGVLGDGELDDAHLWVDAGLAELAEHGARSGLYAARGAPDGDGVVGRGGGSGRVRVGREDLHVVELRVEWCSARKTRVSCACGGRGKLTCRTVTGIRMPSSDQRQVMPSFRASTPVRCVCGVHWC